MLGDQMKEQKAKSIYNLKFPVKLVVRREDELLHWHKDLEILCVLSGKVNLQVNNAYYELGEDDIFLINSEDLHSICLVSEKSTYLFVNISIPYFEKFFKELEYTVFIDDDSINLPMHENLQKEIRWRISQMLLEIKNKNVDYQNRIIYHTSSLLAGLIDHYNMVKKNVRTFRSKEQLSRIWKAYEYMYNQSHRKLELKEVADYVHVSSSYLSHTIKEAMGLSFEKMLNQIRAEHSMKFLLNSNDSISKISRDCGFSDPKYFKKYFLQFFHCSPEEYRNHNQHKVADGDFEAVNYFQTLVFHDLLLEKIAQYEDEPIGEVEDTLIDMTVNFYEKVPYHNLDKYWQRQLLVTIQDLQNCYELHQKIQLIYQELYFHHVVFTDVDLVFSCLSKQGEDPYLDFRYLDLLVDRVMELNAKPGFRFSDDKVTTRRNMEVVKEEIKLHYLLKYGEKEIELWTFEYFDGEYKDEKSSQNSGISIIHDILRNKKQFLNYVSDFIDDRGLKNNLYFTYLMLQKLELGVIYEGEYGIITKGFHRIAILLYHPNDRGKRTYESAINVLNLKGKRFLLRQFSLYSQQETMETFIKNAKNTDFISQEDIRAINRGRYPDLSIEFIDSFESIHRSISIPANRAEILLMERIG